MIDLQNNATFLISVKYDNTFNGSQFQTNKNTVQNQIKNFFNYNSFSFVSRTDSGVSALKQIGRISFNFNLNINKFLKWTALFNKKHYRINITKVTEFNSKQNLNIISKTYIYIFELNYIKKEELTFSNFQKLNSDFNFKKFENILISFEGTHNFRKFSTKPSVHNFVRTIYSIDFKIIENKYIIYITGNGFLRQMIRHFIGYALAKTINKKNYSPASPYGLILKDISLKNDIIWHHVN